MWWLPLQDLGNDEQPDTSSAAVARYDENLRYITVGGENVNRVGRTVDTTSSTRHGRPSAANSAASTA